MGEIFITVANGGEHWRTLAKTSVRQCFLVSTKIYLEKNFFQTEGAESFPVKKTVKFRISSGTKYREKNIFILKTWFLYISSTLNPKKTKKNIGLC
jgi:hypothetical protein